MKDQSTVTTILSITDEELSTLENRNEVCVVFFDFKNAFHSVPISTTQYNMIHCVNK